MVELVYNVAGALKQCTYDTVVTIGTVKDLLWGEVSEEGCLALKVRDMCTNGNTGEYAAVYLPLEQAERLIAELQTLINSARGMTM